MQKVYADGFCNIAATAAVDSSKGLFFPRDVYNLQPCLVNIPWMGKSDVLYEIVDLLAWNRNILSAPLNQRAWVLQERLLAPRVLHFGKEQLCWECCEMEATENYFEGVPGRLPGEPQFKCLDPKIDSAALITQSEHEKLLWPLQKWQMVIYTYSKMNLTFPSDKLIALSGIASHFKSICKDEYVAGMWRRFLCGQLLWRPEHIGSEVCRPQQYRGPSFSWIALDGKILPGEATDEGIVAKILDVSIDRLNDNEMGPVVGGHLVISGPVKPIHLQRFLGGKDYNWAIRSSNGKYFKAGAWADVGTDSFPQSSSLMQIKHRKLQDGSFQILSLLLAHIPGSRGDYRRVGSHFASESNDVDILQEHGGEENVPCEKYDPDTGHHIIRIF
jgi:hypothetical protein